jgi:hypothetical protein
VKLKLLEFDEEYEFSLPSAYARSILTVPWVELGDRVTINCFNTNYSSSVIFHTKVCGFYLFTSLFFVLLFLAILRREIAQSERRGEESIWRRHVQSQRNLE